MFLPGPPPEKPPPPQAAYRFIKEQMVFQISWFYTIYRRSSKKKNNILYWSHKYKQITKQSGKITNMLTNPAILCTHIVNVCMWLPSQCPGESPSYHRTGENLWAGGSSEHVHQSSCARRIWMRCTIIPPNDIRGSENEKKIIFADYL